MTLLYIDGYDYFSVGNLSGALLSSMNYYNITSGSNIAVGGAFGGSAMQINGGPTSNPTNSIDLMAPAYTGGVSVETVIGQRMKWGGFGTGTFFGVLNSADNFVKFKVGCSAYGEILLMDNNEVILARSPPGTVALNSSDYVEIKFTVSSGGTGRVRIRINTDLKIDFTGTLSVAGASGWNVLRWSTRGFSVYVNWDDLYVLTTTGANNNDYLGNVRVRLQLPNGAGDTTQLTPTGAPTNWQAQINPLLNTSIYDYTSTVGNFDLYTMQPNAAARNIYGLQMRGSFMQDDATQLQGGMVLKTGGTTYDSAPFFLSSSYDSYLALWERNPNTGLVWSNTDLNSLQAGPKLIASA